MEIIETNITERKVKFIEYDTSKNWIQDFPTDNWCLLIIADEELSKNFDEIIRKSIDRKVGYIFSVGKQYDFIHDLADEIIAIRASEIEDNFLPDHVIMTAGEEDFEEGIWFGLNLTFNSETEINEILILDIAKKYKSRTLNLIRKFENGYLPPE